MTEGFYVTVKNDKGKTGALLGPYTTHKEALDNVSRGTKLAYDADPRAPWYSYGTTKLTAENLPKSVFGV